MAGETGDRSTYQSFFILGLFVTLIGIVLIGSGGWDFFKIFKIKSQGVATEAFILDIDVQAMRRRTNYGITVGFITTDQRRVKQRVVTKSEFLYQKAQALWTPGSISSNSMLTIKYLPSDPHQVILVDDTERNTRAYWFFGGGAIALFVGALMAVLGWKWSKGDYYTELAQQRQREMERTAEAKREMNSSMRPGS